MPTRVQVHARTTTPVYSGGSPPYGEVNVWPSIVGLARPQDDTRTQPGSLAFLYVAREGLANERSFQLFDILLTLHALGWASATMLHPMLTVGEHATYETA